MTNLKALKDSLCADRAQVCGLEMGPPFTCDRASHALWLGLAQL